MIALIAALMAYSVLGPNPPQAGTFTIIADGPSIIRVDTRTGTMERCMLTANEIKCEPIKQ